MRPTFRQFQAEYPDDAACLRAVMISLFGGSRLYCPRCLAETEFHAMSKRRAYACQDCGHHLYPCAGTIFHKTRTPLTGWFYALHLMASNSGVRAVELERQIGCSPKTASRMARKLRGLVAGSDADSPLWQSHAEILRRLSAISSVASNIYRA